MQFLRIFSWLNAFSATLTMNALCSIALIISYEIVIDIHVDWHLDWLTQVTAIVQSWILLKFLLQKRLFVHLLLTLLNMGSKMLILLDFCPENLVLT